jgi:phosphoadenosine phosphosulfate reductase
MGLITSSRPSREDMRIWTERERLDRELYAHGGTRAKEQIALDALKSFAAAGSFYVSVSWGKDSVVVADLVASNYDELGCPPIVWFPAGAIENPDCVLVRDAFLRMHDIDYHEIEASLTSDEWDRTLGHDGAQAEFELAAHRFGRRYASGVRAEESGIRKMAVGHHGLVSHNSCRPIGTWGHQHVYAYLVGRNLPIHPAYACTLDGAIDRAVLRVSTIGGERGRRFGRAEWERRYYPEIVAKLARPDM